MIHPRIVKKTDKVAKEEPQIKIRKGKGERARDERRRARRGERKEGSGRGGNGVRLTTHTAAARAHTTALAGP